MAEFRASLKTRLIKEKADRYGSCKETFRRRAVAPIFFSLIKRFFRDALMNQLYHITDTIERVKKISFQYIIAMKVEKTDIILTKFPFAFPEFFTDL